jgi:hypothetical protein
MIFNKNAFLYVLKKKSKESNLVKISEKIKFWSKTKIFGP